MAGGKRLGGQELGDFCAAYGFVPGDLDYAAYVGLVLNQRRIEVRRAAPVVEGLGGDIPLDWFEHLTDDPQEARRWRAEAMRDRALRDELAKLR